jgi:hypothetical protein
MHAPRDIRSGSGLLKHGGSFVTLVSPSGEDVTIVIEKMSWEGSASAWQALQNYNTSTETLLLQFEPAAFSGRRLAVWKSVLHADKPSIEDMFVRQTDVTVSDAGTVTIDVCIDCLFTITTRVTAGHKGMFPPSPPAKPFPLPFRDDFDNLAVVSTS